MINKNKPIVDISEFFQHPSKVTEILQSGIHAALQKHKLAGNAVCEWKDGKVVWISPEKIPVDKNNSSND